MSARAEDRALITATLHRFARLAREDMDPDEVGRLFAPDAVFRLPGGLGEVNAREHLRNHGPDTDVPHATYVRHHLTTVDISFAGEDEAHVESLFLGITSEGPQPDQWGTYKDVFRRQPDGSWLFAVRDIPMEDMGCSAEGSCARMWPQLLELWEKRKERAND